jgi:3',5'-nucleoside bisphosphate phosphatase
MNARNILNADLHCHSVVSDGTLTPEELAVRARDGGVELWALTDHDEVGGQARALAACKANGLAYLTGVEVSVTFAKETIHIVGLGVDPSEPTLCEGLARTRSGRDQRAVQMGDELAKVGIKGAYEGALKYVGNPALVSRTHVARYLVEAGHCASTYEVFSRYLVEGKPGYVSHTWASLSEAVGWIKGSGGMAVMAHPARYKRLTTTEHWALFSEFREAGGEAVEVVTGSHSEAEARQYAQLALDLGLYASRGSDFHSPDESRVALGALPFLTGKLKPVWEALEHRIQ